LSRKGIGARFRFQIGSCRSYQLMHDGIQEFAMQEQSRCLSRLRFGLRCLVVATLLPILGCGDPATGTIKAPKREEMTGGGPGAVAPTAPAKKAKTRGREVELKTMTPGGKKM
jgi:hypothetical protein